MSRSYTQRGSDAAAGSGGLIGAVAAEFERYKNVVAGKVLTKPLLSSVGNHFADPLAANPIADATYVVDVGIGRGQAEPLRNVPISPAAREVHYADVGSAVTLLRSPVTGQFEIVGFAKSVPGSYKEVGIDIDDGTDGAVSDLTLTSRLFTLDELKDYGGGFGVIPLGAYGVFRGSTLLEIRT